MGKLTSNILSLTFRCFTWLSKTIFYRINHQLIKRLLFISPLLFLIYLAGLVFEISITGYWSDVFFSISVALIMFLYIFKYDSGNGVLTLISRITCTLILILVVGSLLHQASTPFFLDKLKLTTFHFIEVNNRLFHAYFIPTGAYSGGEGTFWITESYPFIPFIEIEQYYHHAILWDFRLDKWDGSSVNQNDIVTGIIEREIIQK